MRLSTLETVQRSVHTLAIVGLAIILTQERRQTAQIQTKLDQLDPTRVVELEGKLLVLEQRLSELERRGPRVLPATTER